ncbi:hypothetical protein JTB14_035910 [Gonioctena quinquepunctata]|nr:hypothetical protein JTB14_035910 [Gonioctena quinquepunctata]
MAGNETSVREFEIFKDAIREENLEVQIEMTRRLGSLAEHLGEEITRKELLPFIRENIDFHDEILLNLSEQLNRFVPLVGGYEHSQPILDLLRKLCNTDETIVRAKTVETLKDIAQHLNSELTEELFVPVIEALSSEDWFTSKCSAAALYPTIYLKLKEEKKTELRHSFRVLIQDESPIVRKAAAKSLIDLISVMEKEVVKNEFVPVLDNIFEDPMDSVKVNAVPIALALSKRLTENEIDGLVFKVLTNCADDSSWKIRQTVACHIADIQETIPFGKMRGRILSIFQGLVKDDEAEVRIETAKNLPKYCSSMKKSYQAQLNTENNFEPVFQQSVVPQIMLLSTDMNEDVRLTLSRNILSLSSIVGEECFKQTVMPIIIDILEQDPSMPVQANLLQNLNSLPDDIDLTRSLTSIKNVVRSLIVNSRGHWRTRRSLLVAFMHIAGFARKEYFSDNLKIFYAALLGDPVFAVRRTAPIVLPLLTKRYGIAWATEHIIPYFKMFTKDCRYLYRYVPLFGINELLYPSVRAGCEEKYLKDLKRFCSSDNNELKSSAARTLMKLQKLTSKLKNRLEEKAYEDVLSLNKSIDDFKNDDILLYAGECLATFKENKKRDIFSFDEESTIEGIPSYLEGLLSLIYREFLDLTLDLFDDPIVNVQIRSIYTLNKTKVFTDTLYCELEESWVAESLKLLREEETEAIEKEVVAELSRKTIVRPEEEKVDTDLMEDIIVSDVKPELVSGDIMPDLDIHPREKKIPEIKVEAVKEEESICEDEKTEVEKYPESTSMVVGTPATGETQLSSSVIVVADVYKDYDTENRT